LLGLGSLGWNMLGQVVLQQFGIFLRWFSVYIHCRLMWCCPYIVNTVIVTYHIIVMEVNIDTSVGLDVSFCVWLCMASGFPFDTVPYFMCSLLI